MPPSDWITEKSCSPIIRPTRGARRGIFFKTSVGSTPRATNQSKLSSIDSARRAETETLANPRVDSRRKTALRWLDSTSVILQPGCKIAIGTPGNPAPEPESTMEDAPDLTGKWAPKNSDSQ